MSQLAEIRTLDDVTGVESWRADLRPSRILFGPGRLRELGELVRELGGSRVLVVTDPGIRAAGHVSTALDSLAAAALAPFVFDGVHENPTTSNVEDGVEIAREHEIDFLVGLGGGSSMDCAKGINFLLTNGGRMEDYWGFNKATEPMLASVGIPCTAGTGSEAQSFALIAQEVSHLKMACGDEKVRFKASILDPLLAVTAPREVKALAGYDALSHAVESFVTRARNPLGRLFAKEAWVLLEKSYLEALSDEAEPACWGRMLLGSHLAGAAIETSMLGAAHALANPLTSAFGTTHGAAIALVLAAVVRANSEVAEDSYRELARASGLAPTPSGAAALATHLEELRSSAGLPATLASAGVGRSDLSALASQAMAQWTLQHNPRTLSEAEIRSLYEEVL